jgi:hypothetical protein
MKNMKRAFDAKTYIFFVSLCFGISVLTSCNRSENEENDNARNFGKGENRFENGNNGATGTVSPNGDNGSNNNTGGSRGDTTAYRSGSRDTTSRGAK